MQTAGRVPLSRTAVPVESEPPGELLIGGSRSRQKYAGWPASSSGPCCLSPRGSPRRRPSHRRRPQRSAARRSPRCRSGRSRRTRPRSTPRSPRRPVAARVFPLGPPVSPPPSEPPPSGRPLSARPPPRRTPSPEPPPPAAARAAEAGSCRMGCGD